MYQTHLELNDLFANSKSVESRMETLKSEIESLQDQNKAVEAEKDRFLEIKKAKERLKLLRKFHVVVAYYAAHEEHLVSKKKMKVKQKMLTEISQKVENIAEERNKLQKQAKKVAAFNTRAVSNAKECRKDFNKLMSTTTMDSLEESIDDAILELEEVGKAKEKMESKLERQKKTLESKQKDLDKFEDLESLEEQITELKSESRKIDKHNSSARTNMGELHFKSKLIQLFASNPELDGSCLAESLGSVTPGNVIAADVLTHRRIAKLPKSPRQNASAEARSPLPANSRAAPVASSNGRP